ncbi:MAG: hydantoinase B/oxoprolinase family protein, partial [Bacteroidales bacterium]
MSLRSGYKISIDTGGTFTDCIGLSPEGVINHRKVLSSGCLRGEIEEWVSATEFRIREFWDVSPDFIKGFKLSLIPATGETYLVTAYDPSGKSMQIDRSLPSEYKGTRMTFEVFTGEEAPVLGIRLITNTPLHQSFPPVDIRLGTTKGTNALLEMRGSEPVLVTTSGFKDILLIGNQQRPDIFAWKIFKPPPLTTEIVEVDERIDSHGSVLCDIEINTLEEKLLESKNKGIKSVAISLINAYQNPVHEQQAAAVAKRLGYQYISVSSELSSMIKFLDRTETTVVNAYLSPIIRNYLHEISRQVKADGFRVMTSAGGLVRASFFQPVDSLLSGPAGGVVGAAVKGKQLGESHLITFDMGGTSTDVSRFDGDFDYIYELKVGAAHIMSPALTIETVAAGGGSICGFDGYRLFVGPESAGANPGPACYGAGGPLTLTDINLLAGRLHPDNFTIPIYPDAAEKELSVLAAQIERSSGNKPSSADLIDGFLTITNEIMAGAIKKISVLKGYSPVNYSLVSFGGAGGLHACSIASLLGIRKIILPEEAGLLSAFGIGRAKIERFAEKLVLQPFDRVAPNLGTEIYELEKEAISKLLEEGIRKDQMEIRNRKIFLRYEGQDHAMEMDYEEEADMKASFREHYYSVYGHTIGNRIIELQAIRVVASEREAIDASDQPSERQSIAEPIKVLKNKIAVYHADQLKPGHMIEGPALLLDRFSTTFIEEGWQYLMHSNRTGILTASRTNKLSRTNNRPFEAELELFTNRFMAIAEHMGAMLQRTAFSVNIKERLDFSCALLDAEGNLVANAPHIPVHLGGLSVCVKALIQKITFKPGDTVITNHPAFGGSHLPDVTTVTPVFDDARKLAGFVVNRAHHSEIGGISPGSMPPSAANLAQEGVVIPPFLLVENARANWKGIRRLLTNSPYPSRNPEENLADLNAALAANKKGADALRELSDVHGTPRIEFFFHALRKHAHDRILLTLEKIPDGEYSATEFLDDGSPISVRVLKESGKCIIDFTGSSPVHPSNMNATVAIVHSVVIYVLRLLLNEPIPLNDGLLEPVDIIVPHGLLNPDFPEDPFQCPAVVGGNVEISQRLTDTLIKAFGTMAASQGTMNNVLFGNDRFGYYETLAGGTGAGADFHGSDAVHHHMTNTRITDPEVIEFRYPVRIIRTSIRKDSGGPGKYRGGDGMIREFEFLEPVNLSLLTQRRTSGPYGMKGGGQGKKGKQCIIKPDGSTIELGSIV